MKRRLKRRRHTLLSLLESVSALVLTPPNRYPREDLGEDSSHLSAAGLIVLDTRMVVTPVARYNLAQQEAIMCWIISRRLAGILTTYRNGFFPSVTHAAESGFVD